MRWLMESYYEADHIVSPHELYNKTMSRIIQYMFKEHMVQGEIIAKDALIKWHTAWNDVALHTSLTDEEIMVYSDKGYAAIVNLVSKMADNIHVLDINIPWQSEWKIFNTRIIGTLPVFTTNAIDNEHDRKLYCISTLSPYVTSRNTEAAMQIYSLSREALTQDVHSIKRRDNYRMQTIDPSTGNIQTYKATSGRKQLPLLGTVIQQMQSKLCIPNYHNHCNRCPYKSACDTKYLSSTCLSHKKETKKRIEKSSCMKR